MDVPVFTFSSSTTNSMRGAVNSSSLKNAIVVDIGGASTDVGVLVNGFPRESPNRVTVGFNHLISGCQGMFSNYPLKKLRSKC